MRDVFRQFRVGCLDPISSRVRFPSDPCFGLCRFRGSFAVLDRTLWTCQELDHAGLLLFRSSSGHFQRWELANAPVVASFAAKKSWQRLLATQCMHLLPFSFARTGYCAVEQARSDLEIATIFRLSEKIDLASAGHEPGVGSVGGMFLVAAPLPIVARYSTSSVASGI